MTHPIPSGPDALLAEIEAFIARTGISRTKFGIDAVNDPRLVSDIAAGRNLTLKTVSRIRAFIANEERAA